MERILVVSVYCTIKKRVGGTIMSQSLIVAIILIVMIVSFFAGYIPMAATALSVPMFLQPDYFFGRFEAVCRDKAGSGGKGKTAGAVGGNADERGVLNIRLSGQRNGYHAAYCGCYCKGHGAAGEKYH